MKKNRLVSKMTDLLYSKEENPEYNRWLESADEQTKLQLKSFSNSEVDDCFGKIIHANKSGITTKLGIGTNRLNVHTINHLARALKRFLGSNDHNEEIILLTNNYSNSIYFELFNQTLKENGFDIYSYKDYVQVQGLLSYSLFKEESKLGIYIDIVKDEAQIKIFNPGGTEFNIQQYSKFNSILQKYTFSLSKNLDKEKQKYKVLDEKVKVRYETKLVEKYKKLFSVLAMSVVVHSDATEKLMEKIKIVLELNINICRDVSKKRNDSLTPDSFTAAYFQTKKVNSRVIFNINSSGSKVGLAYKQEKIWKFLTSLEMGLLYYSLFDNQVEVKTSMFVPTHFEKLSSKNPKNSVYIGTSFNHKLNNFDWNDGFINIMFIISKIYNGDTQISKELQRIKSVVGNYYETQINSEISNEAYKSYLENVNIYRKMDDVQIKSISIIENSKYLNVTKLFTQTGEIILTFNKLNNELTTYIYTIEDDYIKAYQSKNDVKKATMKFLLRKDSANDLDSNSGLARTFLFIGIFVVGMSLVFAFQFNWAQIGVSTTILFTSMTTWEPYILFCYLLVYPLMFATCFYLIMKQYKEETKYIHVLKASLVYVFISAIIPIAVASITSIFWYLRRKGYKTSEIFPAVSVIMLVYSVTSISFSLSMTLYTNSFMVANGMYSATLFWCAIGGTMLFAFNFVFLFMFAYFPRLQYWLFFLIEKFLFVIKKSKHYNSIQESVTFNIKNTKQNADLALKNIWNTVLLCVVFVAGKLYANLAFYGSVNLVAKNFAAENGLQQANVPNYWAVSGANSMIGIASFLIPIPGGMGLTEYYLQLFLDPLYGMYLDQIGYVSATPEVESQIITDLTIQSSFMFRFFSYYGIVLMTFIPYLIALVKSRAAKSRNKGTAIWEG